MREREIAKSKREREGGVRESKGGLIEREG